MSPQATKDLVWAKYLALGCAMLGLMVGEYLLAVRTGSPWQIAWTYPVALDVYAYASFRSGRRGDVTTALVLMALSQAAAHAPLPHDSIALAIAPWAVVMPIVLWRVHHLSSNHTPPVVVEDTEDTADSSPNEKGEPVSPCPQPTRKRWTKPAAQAAIRYWESEGLTKNTQIAAKMGISPQMVGNYRRGLVAA